MIIQILIVLLFALNLLLIFTSGRFSWYRLPGSLIFALLPLTTVFFDQPRFALDYFWWPIAGAVFIVLGLALIAWAVKELGLVLPVLGEQAKELKTSGPYQFVRHPVCLGLVFIFTGWWWVFAAVYAFYFGMFILALIWINGYLEEKLILEKQFGEKYQEYKQQTGMFWVK